MLAPRLGVHQLKPPTGVLSQWLPKGPSRCRASAAITSFPVPAGGRINTSNSNLTPSIPPSQRGADTAPSQQPSTDAASAQLVSPQPPKAATVPTELQLSYDGAALMSWVCEQGGYVHPLLAVVECTPATGCRGVVATSAIQLQELGEAPLIAVPERLYMTSEHARQLLTSIPSSNRWLSILGHQPQPQAEQPMSSVLKLAILLAHERAKGKDSFWHPYINALPSQPPAAWLMSPEQLAVQLQGLGSQAADWHKEVQAMRHSMQQQAAQAARQYGRKLQGVNEENVLWALAQVVSRAFGGGEEIAMAPLIDMCNHKLHAATPSCWVDEESGGEPVVFITSLDRDQPRPLGPGDELFISYLSNCSPLAAFLNFGFVPDELRPGPVCSIAVAAWQQSAA